MTTQGKILEELGRRAVACRHWRWMPGMTILGSKGRRVVVIGLSGATEATSGMNSRAIGPDELPDLSSPATLGCLLHAVREAWPDEWHGFMVPIFDGFSHWRVGCLQLERLPGTPQVIVPVNQETMKPLAWAYSEAEALVVALEAAP